MSSRKPKLVGTVFKLFGKQASVRVDIEQGHRVFDCHLRGRLFDDEEADVKTQIAVGDRVEIDPLVALELHAPDETVPGVLHEVLERRTAVVRMAGRRKPRLQVLAANVDQLVVVSALLEPPLKTGLIDRYLAIAETAQIAPAVCLNKVDLDDGVLLDEARRSLRLYAELGYPLVFTCAKKGVGLDELRALLMNKRSMLVGHSGVGKSKLATAMVPDAKLASGEVTRRGRGRHTTSASTLLALDFGGELVDTPGVRELSLRHIDRADLAAAFVEFRPHLDACHFSTCSHVPEPHCGVKNAVDEGAISRTRYESYCGLYEELG
ncbi:MAG TPA: ribosome small subunit-dependent GTPase A [Vicinamibacteria bacterium]|nr:ribosome small subunit-dependent GTPase A [Vicinamibacteria bacterium]